MNSSFIIVTVSAPITGNYEMIISTLDIDTVKPNETGCVIYRKGERLQVKNDLKDITYKLGLLPYFTIEESTNV